MISGLKTPALLSVWASNDVVQFGTVKILSGGAGPQQTEFDTHAGDAVFYVKNGPMTFYIPDRVETYDVEPGDFMFIPKGERYKIINYYGHTIEAVLWWLHAFEINFQTVNNRTESSEQRRKTI